MAMAGGPLSCFSGYLITTEWRRRRGGEGEGKEQDDRRCDRAGERECGELKEKRCGFVCMPSSHSSNDILC